MRPIIVRFRGIGGAALALTALTALSALTALGAPGPAGAEPARQDLAVAGAPLAHPPTDPRIAQALRAISSASIRHTIDTLVGFHTRSTLSSTVTLPKGEGIGAAADWIEAEFRRISAGCGGCLDVRRDHFIQAPGRRIPTPTPITNVYAVLHGSDPQQASRMVLVTGHYDSRDSHNDDARGAAPGANDDASGVAVSLECARALTRLRPAATVVFVAVAGEEQGLYGSQHLAELARHEGWRLQGVLNNDIVGGDTTPGDRWQDLSVVRVFSEGIPAAATPEERKIIETAGYDSDSPSRELARAMLEVGQAYPGVTPVLELRPDRFLRGGDHLSFNAQGFAAVRLTEWRENFAHQHQDVRVEGGVQYGDLPRFVDDRYVAAVAALNAATLATLAQAPGAPAAVRILTGGLDNDTRLEWQPDPAAPADTQYQVLWRATAAASWQRFLAVPAREGGDASAWRSVTVPVAKDNVVFGVRAVDAGGHASAAVVPWPEAQAHAGS